MSNGNALVVSSGSTVRFPVASDDPLAKFQQLKTVAQLENLHDIAFVRALVAANPNLSMAQVSAAVNSFLSNSQTSQITTINIPVPFQVEAGATLILSGPITVINAQDFYVDGTIICYGSLNINCTSIGALPGGGSIYGQGSGSGSGWPVPPGPAHPHQV
jgi:hypothetical protein